MEASDRLLSAQFLEMETTSFGSTETIMFGHELTKDSVEFSDEVIEIDAQFTLHLKCVRIQIVELFILPSTQNPCKTFPM